MRVSSKVFSCLAVLALATAAAPAAWAEDAIASAAGGQGIAQKVDQILVTAQKREEALQEVPIAVSAFTADTLQQTGVGDMLDLVKITPSLLITEGSSQAQPFIRGVGGRNITPGNEATTAVYVDGVYQTDKTGLLLQSFPDVESVQVLRGPQGTLFGRNATSGAILVTTKRPEHDLGAMFEATAGTEESGGRAFVTGGLAPTLSFSLSGFYRYESGYLKNFNPDNGEGNKTGDERSYGIRGNLLWEPTDNFSALLQGSYSNGYTRALMAVQPVIDGPTTLGEAVSLPQGIDIRHPPRSYYGEIDPQVRFDGWNVSLTMEADFDALSVKSISAYSESGSGVQLDLDASPVSVFWFDTDLKGRTWQQEIDITSNNSGPFQWILGAFYINYRDGYTQLDQYVGLPVPATLQPHTVPQSLFDASAAGAPPGSAVYIDQHSFVTVESLGIFGEASYEFTDSTKLTVGLRYTDESARLDENNASTTYLTDGVGGVFSLTNTSLAVCNANPDCDDLKTSFSELTYRAVLDHQFNDDVLAYASYNRGFKSGVYNISSIPNVIATEPETIDAFEIGLKTTAFDRSLTINTAAYYYKYDNLQVPVVDPNTNTQKSINAAKATISGLEAEITWAPDSQLSLSAGFSTFFESKYDSFPNCEIYRPTGAGLAIVPNADCSGEDLPSTPNFMFSLSGTYNIPIGNDGSIELSGLFSYIDKFDHATHGFYPAGIGAGGVPFPAGEGRAPIQRAIETLNLSVTYHAPDDRFYVTLWGKDLLDSNDTYRNLFTTSFGYYTSLTRGISGGITLGMKFGSQR